MRLHHYHFLLEFPIQGNGIRVIMYIEQPSDLRSNVLMCLTLYSLLCGLSGPLCFNVHGNRHALIVVAMH